MKRDLVLPAAAIAVAGSIAAALPWLGASSYVTTLVYYGAYYLALGQAWNLMSGLTGYVSFAHGALAGIGAYAAIIALNGNWSVAGGVAAGAVTAILASLLIGITSLRLRGIAFTFATLFFQELVLLVVRKLPLTGGAGGVVLKHILPSHLPHALMAGLAVLATLAFVGVRASRVGVRLLAIKGDEDAAAAIGIDSTRLKIAVFCASAAICGLAGAVHAISTASLFPDVVFSVDTSLIALAVPLIGGVGSAYGAVAGAVLYVGIREFLQIVAPALHLVIVGALILLVTLFVRGGLVAQVARLYRKRRASGAPA